LSEVIDCSRRRPGDGERSRMTGRDVSFDTDQCVEARYSLAVHASNDVASPASPPTGMLQPLWDAVVTNVRAKRKRERRKFGGC